MMYLIIMNNKNVKIILKLLVYIKIITIFERQTNRY